uniref:Uncharacterized protein n=1 Tax=uncultured bacterium A1Q1_fos_291 TaxID=1256570 RepID=L7VXD5_9BACT|nr:hypothetical protein [uncultured bacterium A1Q1_fos_291]
MNGHFLDFRDRGQQEADSCLVNLKVSDQIFFLFSQYFLV